MRGEKALSAGEDVMWKVHDDADDRAYDGILGTTVQPVRQSVRAGAYDPVSIRAAVSVGAAVDVEVGAWAQEND